MEQLNLEREQDRRNRHRYAIRRELRFKVLKEDRIISVGTGQTTDLSSKGVAFEATGLKIGAWVELSISWPVLLGETCRMRLIIFGRVVRADKRTAACTIDRYEFRTQARTDTAPVYPRVDSTLRRWVGSVREIKTAQASL